MTDIQNISTEIRKRLVPHAMAPAELNSGILTILKKKDIGKYALLVVEKVGIMNNTAMLIF